MNKFEVDSQSQTTMPHVYIDRYIFSKISEYLGPVNSLVYLERICKSASGHVKQADQIRQVFDPQNIIIAFSLISRYELWFLMKHFINTRCTKKNERFVLELCAIHGLLDALELMHSRDSKICTDNKHIIFEAACRYGRANILTWVMQKYPVICKNNIEYCILNAIAGKQYEIIKILIGTEKMSMNHICIYTSSVIVLWNGHKEIADMLFDMLHNTNFYHSDDIIKYLDPWVLNWCHEKCAKNNVGIEWKQIYNALIKKGNIESVKWFHKNMPNVRSDFDVYRCLISRHQFPMAQYMQQHRGIYNGIEDHWIQSIIRRCITEDNYEMAEWLCSLLK